MHTPEIHSSSKDIRYLYNLKNEQIKTERFLEAQKTEQQIQELLKKSQESSMMSLDAHQKEQALLLDQKILQESVEFKKRWDIIISTETERQESYIKELRNKHEEDMENERNRLEKSIPLQHKPSPLLQSLIQSKEKAVRINDLEQAEKYKKKAEVQREKEVSAYENFRDKTIDKKLHALEAKFCKDLEILKDKQDYVITNLKKQRKVEQDRQNKMFVTWKNKQERSQRVFSYKLKNNAPRIVEASKKLNIRSGSLFSTFHK